MIGAPASTGLRSAFRRRDVGVGHRAAGAAALEYELGLRGTVGQICGTIDAFKRPAANHTSTNFGQLGIWTFSPNAVVFPAHVGGRHVLVRRDAPGDSVTLDGAGTAR